MEFELKNILIICFVIYIIYILMNKSTESTESTESFTSNEMKDYPKLLNTNCIKTTEILKKLQKRMPNVV